MEKLKKVRIALLSSSSVKVGENVTLMYVYDYTGRSKYDESTVVVEALSYEHELLKIESRDVVFYVPIKNIEIGYAITVTGNKKVVFQRLVAGNFESVSSKGEAKEFCNLDKNFILVTTTENEKLYLECSEERNITISVSV